MLHCSGNTAYCSFIDDDPTLPPEQKLWKMFDSLSNIDHVIDHNGKVGVKLTL